MTRMRSPARSAESALSWRGRRRAWICRRFGRNLDMLTVLLILVLVFAVVKGLSEPPRPPPNEHTRWYRVPTFQRQRRPKDRYITVRVDEGEKPPFGGQLVAIGADRKIVRKDTAHARASIANFKDKSRYERKQIANNLIWGSNWTKEAEAVIRAWARR
jgi:hypothetical protein